MRNWKRTVPALGALLLLLLTLVPAARPASAAELGQGRVPLKYFWPSFILWELGLVIQPAESFASETMYNLRLQQPGGGQFDVTISGGAAGEAPGRNGQAVTVRGQRGTAFTTGAGYTIIWSEQGQVYAVTGGLGLRDTLAIANGLEEVDLATFRRRLTEIATRPSIYYTNAGAMFEIRPDGSTLRRGRIANLGMVHDAVDFGVSPVALSDQGLQSVVPVGGTPRVIARFTAGIANSGRLIGTADNSYVIYQYVRADARSTSGVTSVVGVVDGRTLRARALFSAPGSNSWLMAVGLSGDGRGVYVVDPGATAPLFAEVKLISISNGRLLRRIPVQGCALALQSPDRRTLATFECRPGTPNERISTLKLYDLTAPARQPRIIDLARTQRGVGIRSLIWAPDSRSIYVTAGTISEQAEPGELWRVNAGTSQVTRVETGIPYSAALLTTDVTGRWLLLREVQPRQVLLHALDLTTGRSTRIPVPNEAVVLRWR